MFLDCAKYDGYLMVGIPYLAAVGSIGVFLCTRGEEVGWCDKSCRGGVLCYVWFEHGALQVPQRGCGRLGILLWSSYSLSMT